MAQLLALPVLGGDLDDAPISDLVQQIIDQAIQERASDIHLEPYLSLIHI